VERYGCVLTNIEKIGKLVCAAGNWGHNFVSVLLRSGAIIALNFDLTPISRSGNLRKKMGHQAPFEEMA
jgi:hypothetical protein